MSNSLVFARILPQANQLIGVKYSEATHIPLLLMKRPPPPGSTHSPLTDPCPSDVLRMKSYGNQEDCNWTQRVFKPTRALQSLWTHGARELQNFITEPNLAGFILPGISCLWAGIWQERAASCQDLLHYSRTLQSSHPHGKGLWVQVAVSNNWWQVITLACNY